MSGNATSLSTMGHLLVRLEVPAVLAGGQPVPIVLALTNLGTDTITLGMYGVEQQRADFVVMHGSKEIWQKLRGATMFEVLLERHLAPHDSIVFRDVWNQESNHKRRVSAGTYTMRGIVVDAGIASEPVEFRIR